MTRFVVEGTRTWSGGTLVFWFFIIGGMLAAGLTRGSELPWLKPLQGAEQLICLGSFVLGVLSAFFLWRRSIARAGRVELAEGGFTFTRGWRRDWIALADLAGYRDGDVDFVELVRKKDVPISKDFPRLTIPTPTEKDRVTVLAALDASGLRRLSL